MPMSMEKIGSVVIFVTDGCILIVRRNMEIIALSIFKSNKVLSITACSVEINQDILLKKRQKMEMANSIRLKINSSMV